MTTTRTTNCSDDDDHDPGNGAGLNSSFRAFQGSTGATYCLGGRFRAVAQVASDRAKPASQKTTKVMREGLNTEAEAELFPQSH